MGLKYLTIKRELCKFPKFLAFFPSSFISKLNPYYIVVFSIQVFFMKFPYLLSRTSQWKYSRLKWGPIKARPDKRAFTVL